MQATYQTTNLPAQAGLGFAREAGNGPTSQARPGGARQGPARQGIAGQARPGEAWHGPASQE